MKHILFLCVCAFMCDIEKVNSAFDRTASSSSTGKTADDLISCTCGIFLSDTLKKSTKNLSNENITLIHEPSGKFPCSSTGNKMCTRQCMSVVLTSMHNSSELICDALGRDAYREKAHLFIKNCDEKWINTNLYGSRRYCCKNGLPYKCSKH